MIRSAMLCLLCSGLQLTVGEFHSESRCITTQTNALLPSENRLASNAFDLNGVTQLLSYLAMLLDINIQAYDKVPELKLIKSTDIFHSLTYGHFIKLGEWETTFSSKLPGNHRAIMKFLECRQDLARVCFIDERRVYSQDNCNKEIEGYYSLYGINPSPLTKNGHYVVLDGSSRIQRLRFEDAATNQAQIHFITIPNNNFAILENLIDEVTTFLIQFSASISIADSLIQDPNLNCILESPMLSHIITNSTLTEQQQTSLCNHLTDKMSQRKR